MSASCRICGGECEPAVSAGNREYVRCRACGAAQLEPQPSAEELEAFYRTYHDHDAFGRFEERMAEDFPRKARLARAQAADRQRPRLLDIGCGKGQFLARAAELGFDCCGIDASAAAAAAAAALPGVTARHGSIGHEPPSDWRGAFDVVTLWATLEHLPDPAATLAGAAACLSDGGTLLCDTGLGDSRLERWLPGHSQWYAAPEHLFVLSEAALRRLLADAGLRVVAVDRNAERSALRRALKRLRHALVCLAGYAAMRPLLGRRAFAQARREAKWPIGLLLLAIARKGG
jgi:SAM-dependent methyltransferase